MASARLRFVLPACLHTAAAACCRQRRAWCLAGSDGWFSLRQVVIIGVCIKAHRPPDSDERKGRINSGVAKGDQACWHARSFSFLSFPSFPSFPSFLPFLSFFGRP